MDEKKLLDTLRQLRRKNARLTKQLTTLSRKVRPPYHHHHRAISSPAHAPQIQTR